jgi:hypothetical protein
MTRAFRAVWVVVMVASILFASILSFVCYLTALSVASPKCAGQNLPKGQSVGLSDLLAFPLFSAFAIFMIAKIGRDSRTKTMLESYDLVVFEFAWIRITVGMFLVYGVLFGALLFIGLMGNDVALRYRALSNYCSSVEVAS